MLDYISTDRCRMTLLRQYLDDDAAEPCGICDECSDDRIPADLDQNDVRQAAKHLSAAEHPIEPAN